MFFDAFSEVGQESGYFAARHVADVAESAGVHDSFCSARDKAGLLLSRAFGDQSLLEVLKMFDKRFVRSGTLRGK